MVEEFLTTPEMTEQIQTVDFPDWRSPITSSRCPFATGKSTSTTRIPVTTHGVLRERTKIEGEELSTIASLVLKGEIKVLIRVSKINIDLDSLKAE